MESSNGKGRIVEHILKTRRVLQHVRAEAVIWWAHHDEHTCIVRVCTPVHTCVFMYTHNTHSYTSFSDEIVFRILVDKLVQFDSVMD